MVKVALSGAGGQVGAMIRPRLVAAGVALRSGAGAATLSPCGPNEEIVSGDLRDPAAVDALLAGVDVLIHLAGTSVERPLPEVTDNNLTALHAVYEGCRRHRVKRAVFASSNHAFGLYPVTEKLGLDAPFRPDGLYGLSKMWGEGLARLYWEKHGIEGIVIRIGTILARPTEPRHLSTWFGLDDLMQMLERCIAVPEIGFLTVWGVSANDRSYWDQTGSERLGYRPVQNAEAYAADILSRPNPLAPAARDFQGGSFVLIDNTRLGGA